MRNSRSRVLKCGLWAIVACVCTGGSVGQPSAARADKDPAKAKLNGVDLDLDRVGELRTLDVGEVEKKAAEAARKWTWLNLGPKLDHKRSLPRIGYCVYESLLMPGDHYYGGKLIRADMLVFVEDKGKELKAALTKKFGGPERGPKFEWMKVEVLGDSVEERWHWNLTTTSKQGGKPIEIKIACELTIFKNDCPIVSVCDTERAELVGRARSVK